MTTVTRLSRTKSALRSTPKCPRTTNGLAWSAKVAIAGADIGLKIVTGWRGRASVEAQSHLRSHPLETQAIRRAASVLR